MLRRTHDAISFPPAFTRLLADPTLQRFKEKPVPPPHRSVFRPETGQLMSWYVAMQKTPFFALEMPVTSGLTFAMYALTTAAILTGSFAISSYHSCFPCAIAAARTFL